jgi:uncharacterized membrane protein YwzB
MQLRERIKQHPVLSYCLFVMLWSFSWWAIQKLQQGKLVSVSYAA